ncbi:hypothetical protein VT84_18775 [Gemmata sp. SH-PL17]|uniref:hypothetical protein n=1 Tax=Gemmata sp. SH-PL17 TaxID=1630693 RepID=UPI00078BA93E|nr:hypothetical protein [Gemmata sp. SH-PL17]AMV26450.1 hypothetical protein VT84_18775 [Gemmata sp. SH-PL17]
MTEAEAEQEWFSGGEPGLLLDVLGQPAYPRVQTYRQRKYRLWSCACARRIWHRMSFATAAAQEVVELAEQYADRKVPAALLNAAAQRLEAALALVPVNEANGRVDWLASEVPLSAVWSNFHEAMASRCGPAHVGSLVGQVEYLSAREEQLSSDAAFERMDRSDKALCALLREIFGNPFRKIKCHRKWRTSTAVALAAQMYEARDFSAMPILADALQDAGCDNADVLNHCRGPGPHVRGCWVVDMVLGKE